MNRSQDRKHISVVAGSYHVFGSGAASASLVIDGARVRGNEDLGDNGFVGWIGAEVPVQTILRARSIKWEREAIPGGSARYEGTGRGFLRRRCRVSGTDPLTIPLASRQAVLALEKRRYEEAWAKARAEEAASRRFEFRPSWGGLNLERRERIPVRLPDGCRGTKKGGEWERVSFSYAYPPRRLWPAATEVQS